jgi:selenocysteine lyase/cysteine desulfurase
VTADSGWAWWRERRLPAELVHLDSAAAGRSSTATLAATAAHAEREVTRGAYVAQAEAAPVLDAGRAELAGLLGVPAAGLAAVRARLLGEHAILTTAGAVTRAPREMTEPLLRISPHVDCTPEDLARLRDALHALR